MLRHASFLEFFFGKHHLARFFASAEVKDLHSEPAHYYLPVIAGGFLPWVLFVPLALRDWLRRRRAEDRSLESVLWLWIVLTLLFFSLGSGKRVPYVLPMWPALALVTATLLDAPDESARGRGLLLSWLPIGLIAGALLLPIWQHPRLPVEIAQAGSLRIVIGIALLAGFLVVAWFLRALRIAPAVLSISATLAAVFLVVVITLERLEPQLSMKAVVSCANDTAPKDALLVAFSRYRPGISYYSDRPVLVVGAPHELDYGMSLLPQKASPVIDDRFAELLARPHSLVLVGATDKIDRKLPEWREIAVELTVTACGEWSVVRN
ncbi:MAG: hypothetical protein U1E76_05050 [Planctomycetota bacterium]